MRKWIWISIALVLTACKGLAIDQPGDPQTGKSQSISPADGAAMTQSANTLENLGPAPEWENEVWLNTDRPLPLADLGGQVVLLDMWTFG